MKPKLKPPGTKRSKLEYDILLPSFAFNFHLRRDTKAAGAKATKACTGNSDSGGGGRVY
jgi:hypothetical protein